MASSSTEMTNMEEPELVYEIIYSCKKSPRDTESLRSQSGGTSQQKSRKATHNKIHRDFTNRKYCRVQGALDPSPPY
ncbi:hypothetical protein EYF80_056524 [Liparis tanakae]|uniref:Uncharacterized protein n=1 Tax=Liparis tanakae TaxID=230148 RepID=A0A4Z2EYM4_9TELE|nr:hypothetical protein EYF80_056524 [Liparis tanakae]